jgi:hypothetical protein
MLPEGLCQRKIPMTPSEIEPATFRHVLQRVKQMRQRETLSDIYAETDSLENGGKEIRKDVYKKQGVEELPPGLKRRTIQTG